MHPVLVFGFPFLPVRALRSLSSGFGAGLLHVSVGEDSWVTYGTSVEVRARIEAEVGRDIPPRYRLTVALIDLIEFVGLRCDTSVAMWEDIGISLTLGHINCATLPLLTSATTAYCSSLA
jgi:hypothetical protein